MYFDFRICFFAPIILFPFSRILFLYANVRIIFIFIAQFHHYIYYELIWFTCKKNMNISIMRYVIYVAMGIKNIEIIKYFKMCVLYGQKNFFPNDRQKYFPITKFIYLHRDIIEANSF